MVKCFLFLLLPLLVLLLRVVVARSLKIWGADKDRKVSRLCRGEVREEGVGGGFADI
jgi:hypothetical protein